MASSHLISAAWFLDGCWDASTDGLSGDEASWSVCGAKLLVNCASKEPHHVEAWPSSGRKNRGPPCLAEACLQETKCIQMIMSASSLVLSQFSFVICYTVWIFTQTGHKGQPDSNLLFVDTNMRRHTNTHSPSQTTQCLVQNGLIAGLITKETSIRRAPGRDRLAFSNEDPIKLSGSLFNEHRDKDGVTWATQNEREIEKVFDIYIADTNN